MNATLIEQAKAGDSLSLLAARLSRMWGTHFTKGAVSRRLHRFAAAGLVEPRGKPVALKPRDKPVVSKSKVEIKAPPEPVRLPIEPSRERLGCRFITSDRKPLVYCDAPTVRGKSYCEEHHQLTRAPSGTREVNAGIWRNW